MNVIDNHRLTHVLTFNLLSNIFKKLSLNAQKELAAKNPSDKKYTEKDQMFYCSLIKICFTTKCFFNKEYIVNKESAKLQLLLKFINIPDGSTLLTI